MEYPKGYVSGLPNCGVVAIAAITDTPYEEVWNWFKKRNNRPAQWRGGTFHRDYIAALSNFGHQRSEQIYNAPKHTNKPGVQQPMPLHYWVGIYGKKFPDAKFLVSSHNHTMAVQNGIVLDQSGIHPVKDHASKGRRVTQAWIVK